MQLFRRVLQELERSVCWSQTESWCFVGHFSCSWADQTSLGFFMHSNHTVQSAVFHVYMFSHSQMGTLVSPSHRPVFTACHSGLNKWTNQAVSNYKQIGISFAVLFIYQLYFSSTCFYTALWEFWRCQGLNQGPDNLSLIFPVLFNQLTQPSMTWGGNWFQQLEKQPQGEKQCPPHTHNYHIATKLFANCLNWMLVVRWRDLGVPHMESQLWNSMFTSQIYSIMTFSKSIENFQNVLIASVLGGRIGSLLLMLF